MKKYICHSPILFSLSIITAILYCTMGTLFSLIMGRIVDAAGAGIDELIEKFIQGLVFVLIYVLVTILYGVLKNILLGKVRESLKSDLFKATLSAPTSDYSGANTAEYINDLTNNLSIFENSYVKNIYLLVTIVTMFVSASVVTIMAEPLMLVLMVALADTIRNNISLFEKSFSDKSIKHALEDAGLLKLIESLPNGLDTVVEENGKNFSGGERQRLSLARAFLRNRPILILDEGTSAVDAAAAADIEDGLLNNRDLTLIVITHNVSDEHLRHFDSALEIGA